MSSTKYPFFLASLVSGLVTGFSNSRFFFVCLYGQYLIRLAKTHPSSQAQTRLYDHRQTSWCDYKISFCNNLLSIKPNTPWVNRPNVRFECPVFWKKKRERDISVNTATSTWTDTKTECLECYNLKFNRPIRAKSALLGIYKDYRCIYIKITWL